MRTIGKTALALALALIACRTSTAASDPEEGTALVVNGVAIPDTAVKREIVYRLGNRELESRKLEIIVEHEIEQRGKETEDFVKAEDVDQVVETQMARIAEEYQGRLTPEEVLKNNKLSVESLREQARLTLLFNAVFLPENPDDWPAVTREALQGTMPEEQRDLFIEQMKKGYEERQKSGAASSPNDPQKLMFNMLLRQPIMAALTKAADVKTASDGLPPRLVLVVHGVEVTTDEIFSKMGAELAPIEWERTRRWLAKTTAVRQDLEAKGALMSEADFAASWNALEEKYAGSFLQLPQLAMAIKRFPSVDAYRVYRRLLESYERMIADELTDEALTKHLERADQLIGLAQVDADVILCSAYDFKNAEWIPGGWKRAEERAVEVARALADGRPWEAVLEEYSEFWDPPVPASREGQEAMQMAKRNKGRFGMRNRNSLLPLLDESEYLNFVAGSSVGDQIFFDQEVGKVGGPYRGAFGYYIALVKDRTEPSKKHRLEDPLDREKVLNDYVQLRFSEYAARVMEKADVKGL